MTHPRPSKAARDKATKQIAQIMGIVNNIIQELKSNP